METNRFPLFRVPFLALCIILRFYNRNDIIQLSLCSKRSLRVAKKCWKKKGTIHVNLLAKKVPNVDLNFYDAKSEYRFVILGAQDLQDQQTHDIRVGDEVVRSIHKDNKTEGPETVTFWEDKAFGIGQIVGFIKYLFDEPITWIELNTEEYQNEFIRTMDCIMSRQESVETCLFRGCGASIDDCLTHLLDNCKITKNLLICGGPSNQFSHNWNITKDSLYIMNGLSITLQNLTNIDCKTIELGSSSLTNEDLNQFLKHWKNGGNSRLKFLSIERKLLYQQTITSGIAAVEQPGELYRYYGRMIDSQIWKYGGLDIQRNDGKIGTIFIDADTLRFGVDPTPVRVIDGARHALFHCSIFVPFY